MITKALVNECLRFKLRSVHLYTPPDSCVRGGYRLGINSDKKEIVENKFRDVLTDRNFENVKNNFKFKEILKKHIPYTQNKFFRIEIR